MDTNFDLTKRNECGKPRDVEAETKPHWCTEDCLNLLEDEDGRHVLGSAPGLSDAIYFVSSRDRLWCHSSAQIVFFSSGDGTTIC